MATKQILQSDVNDRLAEAMGHARQAVTGTLPDTGAALDAIEAEGKSFIAAILPEYRLAIAAKVKATVARPVLRQALEDYVEAAGGWMRPPAGVAEPGGLLDPDFRRRAEDLRHALEHRMCAERALAAGGAGLAGLRLSKGGMIAAIAAGAISAVVLLGGVERGGAAPGAVAELAQRAR